MIWANKNKNEILANGKILFSVMKVLSSLAVFMGNIWYYGQQMTKGNQHICTKL